MQQAMFGMGGAAPAAAAAPPAPEAPSQPDWSTQLQHMRELGIIDEVPYINDKGYIHRDQCCMPVCYLVYSPFEKQSQSYFLLDVDLVLFHCASEFVGRYQVSYELNHMPGTYWYRYLSPS